VQKKIILNKKIGQTPLDVIDEYKKKNPEYADVKMAYAGRLDPMAEGKLLIIIGEECKNLNKYLGLDKEYIFEILLGFKSDSQDILGLATTDNHHTDNHHTDVARPYETPYGRATSVWSDNTIVSATKKFTGRLMLPYPIFSSKAVSGKKLFLWTLEDRLPEIEIPNREVEVYKLDFLARKKFEKGRLKKEIFKKINSIKEVTEEPKMLGAGFRRTKILARWNELFENIKQEDFYTLKFRCRCSTGTYMRILAEKIAEELGEYGLAYSIKRTKIY